MKVDVLSLVDGENGMISFTSGGTSYEITTPDHEEGFGLILKNSGGSAAKVLIKKGNSIMAAGDLEVTVDQGTQMLVNLKSTGRYKNVYGNNAGTIVVEVVTGSASMAVAAFEL